MNWLEFCDISGTVVYKDKSFAVKSIIGKNHK